MPSKSSISTIGRRRGGRRTVTFLISPTTVASSPLPSSAITPKDIDDLRFGLSIGVDMVAVSFVQTAADLRQALVANATALDAWGDITPLARNEFICWVEDAKQETTRERRIRRTREELEEGQRRPCCWPGCKHRDRTGRQRPA